VTARDLLSAYLTGIAMGCADAVPGVSGGTIALIAGVYERLVAALTAIEPARIRRLAAGLAPANRGDALAAFREMDGPFLAALGAGVLTAVVTVLRLVAHLLSVVPVLTFGFFFGLIAASAAVLLGEVDLSTLGRRAAAAAGFLIAFLASGFAAGALGSGPGIAFLAGAAAVSAMVLPGVSGSLLLLILGQYAYMTGALAAFLDAVAAAAAGNGILPAVRAAPPVAAFCAGGLVGLFTVAHAVRRALRRRRRATVAFLVSLVVGALRAPVAAVGRELAATGGTWSDAAPAFAGAALLGAAAVLVLNRYTGAIEY